MAQIIPTITTDNAGVYQRQLQLLTSFAGEIHVDVSDGRFASSRTLNLNQIYWDGLERRRYSIAVHLMMERPIEWLDQIVSLRPDEVIVHAESVKARIFIPRLIEHWHKFGIKVGIALLPATLVDDVAGLIKLADLVLIFAGKLGYQGGRADLSQLDKVAQIKRINPSATIDWDGGANANNVAEIAAAGVHQINVGSAITNADDERAAYERLVQLAN